MRWEARTAFVEIRPGTRLCIMQTPQIAGQPAPRLRGETPLDIDVNHKWISASVEGATATRATLILPDGTRYEMTPRQPGELSSGITSRMHTQDWVVRTLIGSPSNGGR
jgi:hypothetical protein